MPGRTFEIRYPNGDFEIDAGQYPPPAVGDRIRRKGQLWRVTAATNGKPVVVHVELADERAKHVSR
jgi:hypothetical protein